MGSDIHAVVQRKSSSGKWITYAEGYENRNYDVFAVLANVRNGAGFAGCKTGDGFKVISMPKGLPEDLALVEDKAVAITKDFRWVSRPYRKTDDHPEKEYWLGDHDQSWLTLSELLTINSADVVKKYGYVSAEDFEKLGDYFKQNRYEPRCEYSGGIAGAGIVTMDESDYLAHKQLGTLPDGKRVYVQTWWNETYGEALGANFWIWLVALCKDMVHFDIDPDEIRVVFGFDS
jgi:hypothetical protein